MESVTISIDRYDQIQNDNNTLREIIRGQKDRIDLIQSNHEEMMNRLFTVAKDHKDSVCLMINIEGASNIFKELFENSEFKGTHHIIEGKKFEYIKNVEVSEFYISAVPNGSEEESEE